MNKGKIHSSLAVLLVSDLERSKAFYHDVLGCEVTEFWAIRDGLTGLGFKLIQADSPEDVHPNSRENQIIWDTYGYVDDFETLDSLYDELKSKGAVMVAEPKVNHMDWGSWKEFSIQDPDGYVIGFGAGKK